jgi:spore maturation protein CgeB
MIRLAFYGSSLLSSYWNGAATYYRGLLEPLAGLGWDITFYEPDAFDRQSHRDIEPPSWANSVVYPATEAGLRRVLDEAKLADVMVKASGVGVFDDALLEALLTAPRAGAVRVFWDVDAPATLAELRGDPQHPLHHILPRLDMVLTYGGGAPVVDAYRGFGAPACWPIYNALDPAAHFPVPPDPALRADLAFLANRMPDREARAETFFFDPAARLPDKQFLLGGSGWDGKAMPANVRVIGHIGTERHNAFNCSALAVLNVARESMASMGFCPATRVFEAAGAGACLITDAWEGIELFLQAGEEVLVARDGRDVAEHLATLTPERASEIGARARTRILSEHTYELRARIVDRLLRKAVARRRAEASV